MSIAEAILLTVAAVGHVIFWVSLVNRIHGMGMPRWVIGMLSAFCWTAMVVIMVGVGVGFSMGVGVWFAPLYLLPCLVIAAHGLSRRVRMLLGKDQSPALLSNHTTAVNIARELGRRPAEDRRTEWLSRLPGNQVFDLRVQQKELRLVRLVAALDGLKIAHISDLHMSGRIGPAFYREIFDRVNAAQVDLVAITGDLFDAEACLDWGSELLGKMRSTYGVFFVLGNHDLRVDAGRARQRLVDRGLADLGGCWRTLTVREQPLLLAGNELPWFKPAANMTTCPDIEGRERPLRILLSHAPDQIEWARRFEFDLMMAGHTHGGQIRFPLLGPVVTPSRLGTQYAAGTFDASPTLLHVSRGISSLTPLRWNCPPELAVLVLRSGAVVDIEQE